MEVGLVRSIDIDHEMQQAYLDYAMSVIVARALPDARDGLKPVHRRILYAMYDMGLRPELSHKKSARIVGEVLGKYHPHGDMAVYEAMARMAQDFSMRYMLVDGQGNFGSVDGDPPAAMRYTEARLAAPAMNMLVDIQRNTVNFTDNFDGSLKEPDVLPSALPNMLVNGATGIAVGMSTSIPPHNLGEVIDALIYMLGKWDGLDDINVEDLMRFIQGPDFPTGGIIIQTSNEEENLTSAYGSGRGKVIVQARAHMEEMSRGRNRIIVTELPYMTNKASLVERIADLVREGRLDGIADLRDESDRHGLRIVIELNKNAEPEKLLKELYKATPMRSTFGIIMLALVDGEPRMLSLKQALRVYLDHRLEVIRRRSEYDLEKARQRAHILEGYRVALKNLDEVIDLIRKSPDVETARTRLMKRFKLSEVQAQAILDMPLRRLAALERKKIEEEYKEVQGQIKELESLLRSPKKMRQAVADDLGKVKEAYGDRRRTQILHLEKGKEANVPLLPGELAPNRAAWVAITPEGLISRTVEDVPPVLDGEGASRWAMRVNTRDTLFLVSEQGEAAALPLQSVPEVESPTQGAPFFKISALSEADRLAALFTLPPKEERGEAGFVFTASRQGLVKKSSLSELPGPSARPFTLMKINEGDRFGWLCMTKGSNDILLATAKGMAIRFSEDDVRPMGLVAAGVGGMKLQAGDRLAGLEIIPDKGEILFVASDGKAKRVPVNQFPVQGRYGAGVVAWKLPKNVQVSGITAGESPAGLVLRLAGRPPLVFHLKDVPAQPRTAQGKTIPGIKAGQVVSELIIPADISGQPVQEPFNGKARHPAGDESQAEASTNGEAAGKKAAAVASNGAGKADGSGKAGAKTTRSAAKIVGTKAPQAGSPPAKAAPKVRTPKAESSKPAVKKAAAPKAAASTKAAPKAPASKKPASKAPASKAPAAKTPVKRSPVVKKPAAKKTPAAKPSAPAKPKPKSASKK